MPEVATSHPGLGLRIMSYRATMVGGSLDVRRRRAGGPRSAAGFRSSLKGGDHVHAEPPLPGPAPRSPGARGGRPSDRAPGARAADRPGAGPGGLRRSRGGRVGARGDRRRCVPTSSCSTSRCPGRTASSCSRPSGPPDPTLPVLVLSMHDESVYAERALRAGANGYIMKQEATENVLVALRRILRREVYVSDRIASTMLRQIVSGSRKPERTADGPPERPGAGGLPPDRRGARYPPDRRRAAAEREDRRVLPGAHQGEASACRARATWCSGRSSGG